MKHHAPLALLLVPLFAACGDGNDDDAIAELAGTWQRFEDDGVTVRDQFTFGLDGSYAFDELDGGEGSEEDHIAGTFTVVDGVVSVEAGEIRQVFTYFIDGDRFSPNAGLRIGGEAGEVPGIYRAELEIDDGVEVAGGVTELELRADGTGERRAVSAAGEETSESGTWAFDEVEGDYEFTIELEGITLNLSFDHAGDAIGNFDWVRAGE